MPLHRTKIVRIRPIRNCVDLNTVKRHECRAPFPEAAGRQQEGLRR